MVKKWYYNGWVIALLFAAWPLFIPPIFGIIFLLKKQKSESLINQQFSQYQHEAILQQNNYEQLNAKYTALRGYELEDVTSKISTLEKEYQEKKNNAEKDLTTYLSTLNTDVAAQQEKYNNLRAFTEDLEAKIEKNEKRVSSQTKKLDRIKELYSATQYSIDNFFNKEIPLSGLQLSCEDTSALEELSPTISLKLHYMDVKELRKAFKANDKQLTALLEKYLQRYNTKANKAIYMLMVIALRAELQNTLYNLKYEKLDQGIGQIKAITAKYLQIAGDGNQQIIGTLTKFIGEVEYLFINAVKIEYNYYVKKEQAKQEQAAIREQMRQEVAERKALAEERKKIEIEEEKYNSELAKLSEQLNTANDDETELLKKRLLELEGQLLDVVNKKDEISNLQNGKAGNVYVISNLGSFGNDVFKVGMTRRIDPMDRVKELGDASVPFAFDVHSFIFSDDAVGLESKMHNILNSKRVNKVNTRKEFFNISIDELETLVNDLDPSAEFNKTMIAEEFRQSQSIS